VADRILLTRLLPFDIDTNRGLVGEYSACYKLAIFLTLFSQAFRYAAEPFFFRNKNEVNAPTLYGQVANYFTIVMVFGFLFILIFLHLLKGFIAPEYHNALAIVPIILLANIFLGIYYNFSTWYKLADKTIYGLYIAGSAAIVTFTVNIFFIEEYGYMASAWATLIAYFVMVTICYLLGQKHYPIEYPILKMGGYILFGLMTYFAFLQLGSPTNIGIGLLFFLPFVLLVYLLEKRNFTS